MSFWNKLRQKLNIMPSHLVCIYCGGDKFYKGPKGGSLTNILCANDKCRHWFSYSDGIFPMEDLNRIQPKTCC